MTMYASLASGTAVQFLAEQLEMMNSRISTLSSELSFIKDINVGISNKLNFLSTRIINDLATIKREDRPDEEKLILIEDSISNNLDLYGHFIYNSNSYEKIASSRISVWSRLNETTKLFLRQAEYIYSSLQAVDGADYSPCVLQFCRALENELYIRIFIPFVDELNKYSSINELLIGDLQNKDSRVFAQQIISGYLSRQLTYGQMVFIIQKCHQLGRESYIYKTFYEHIVKHHVSFTVSENLKLLDQINIKLRNKSAHPEVLDIELAKEARTLIPSALNLLHSAIEIE